MIKKAQKGGHYNLRPDLLTKADKEREAGLVRMLETKGSVLPERRRSIPGRTRGKEKYIAEEKLLPTRLGKKDLIPPAKPGGSKKVLMKSIRELKKGGKLSKAKDGNWIQKAVNPKHKGYCTPMTKATCTPRRKALAKTFKKMGRARKGK